MILEIQDQKIQMKNSASMIAESKCPQGVAMVCLHPFLQFHQGTWLSLEKPHDTDRQYVGNDKYSEYLY